ncbi:MAG: hypothetical protein ACP5OE_06250 [Thermodesulfobium sp.]
MKVLQLALIFSITLTTFSFANTCKTTKDCSGALKCCYSKPLPAALENPKDQEGFCTFDVGKCEEVK